MDFALTASLYSSLHTPLTYLPPIFQFHDISIVLFTLPTIASSVTLYSRLYLHYFVPLFFFGLITLLSSHYLSFPNILMSPSPYPVSLILLFLSSQYLSPSLASFTLTSLFLQDVRSKKVISELESLHSVMLRRHVAPTRNQRQPRQPRPLPARKCPATSPDWGMRPDQQREFEDPLVAITTLLAYLTQE